MMIMIASNANQLCWIEIVRFSKYRIQSIYCFGFDLEAVEFIIS